MKTKTLSPGDLLGLSIDVVCANAVKMAKAEQCRVKFEFNGEKLVATPETDPARLAQAYMDECDRARREYEASPEYQRQKEEWDRAEREKRIAVEAALADAPQRMSLCANKERVWRETIDNNKDPYGAAVITYLERWARLMEARMAKGEKLADIADQCSDLANIEGITAFQYGCAVGILAEVWVHGEELRRWHNLEAQIGDEGEKANESGGVLNPALLNFGG